VTLVKVRGREGKHCLLRVDSADDKEGDKAKCDKNTLLLSCYVSSMRKKSRDIVENAET
jgi:hypothetical protein